MLSWRVVKNQKSQKETRKATHFRILGSPAVDAYPNCRSLGNSIQELLAFMIPLVSTVTKHPTWTPAQVFAKGVGPKPCLSRGLAQNSVSFGFTNIMVVPKSDERSIQELRAPNEQISRWFPLGGPGSSFLKHNCTILLPCLM